MASTHIMLTGKMVAGQGEIEWTIAPLPVVEDWQEQVANEFPPMDEEPMPQDGLLQRFIDYGRELQELEDDMADREFWARGEW
jgi:hypothetical protein